MRHNDDRLASRDRAMAHSWYETRRIPTVCRHPARHCPRRWHTTFSGVGGSNTHRVKLSSRVCKRAFSAGRPATVAAATGRGFAQTRRRIRRMPWRLSRRSADAPTREKPPHSAHHRPSAACWRGSDRQTNPGEYALAASTHPSPPRACRPAASARAADSLNQPPYATHPATTKHTARTPTHADHALAAVVTRTTAHTKRLGIAQAMSLPLRRHCGVSATMGLQPSHRHQ